MDSGLFSFDAPFGFNGIQGNYDLQVFEKDAAVIKGKHDDYLFGSQENRHVFLEHGLYQENVTDVSEDQGKQDQQLGREAEFDLSDEIFDFNTVFSTNTVFQEFSRPENTKPVKEMPSSFQLSSLELLSSYGKSSKKLRSSNNGRNGDEGNERGRKKLSTEEIMRTRRKTSSSCTYF
ncbi:hypothetical protein V6N13_002974 [Hibiscus sabdariffa]|uniref:Uncharacterized protein n=1 Tax=Hibiscus sabdariffa TaxID=183260 RepID=A0ABR2NXP8_9ROSI